MIKDSFYLVWFAVLFIGYYLVSKLERLLENMRCNQQGVKFGWDAKKHYRMISENIAGARNRKQMLCCENMIKNFRDAFGGAAPIDRESFADMCLSLLDQYNDKMDSLEYWSGINKVPTSGQLVTKYKTICR